MNMVWLQVLYLDADFHEDTLINIEKDKEKSLKTDKQMIVSGRITVKIGKMDFVIVHVSSPKTCFMGDGLAWNGFKAVSL